MAVTAAAKVGVGWAAAAAAAVTLAASWAVAGRAGRLEAAAVSVELPKCAAAVV